MSKNQPTPSDAPEKPEDKFPAPAEPTIGERAFGALTYTGIGYFANLALSLVIWDFFIDGRGRGVYAGIGRGSKALLGAMGMNPKAAEATGGSIAKYIFSPLGGHVVMIPLAKAEEHARYIAHTANKILDPNYKYKDLAANWNTPEEDLPPLVEEPTEQNWGQIAARRGLGWAAVVGSGMALDKVKLSAPLENGTLRLFDKGLNATGSPALKRLSQKPVFQRYTKLAALDAYFTVITASIAYMTNNLFGKKHGDHPLDGPNGTMMTTRTPAAAPVADERMETKEPARGLIAHTHYTERLAAEQSSGPALPA